MFFFFVFLNYGIRDCYDRCLLVLYRFILLKYLCGLRYGRFSYGFRKFKISFGDGSNDYDEF